ATLPWLAELLACSLSTCYRQAKAGNLDVFGRLPGRRPMAGKQGKGPTCPPWRQPGQRDPRSTLDSDLSGQFDQATVYHTRDGGQRRRGGVHTCPPGHPWPSLWHPIPWTMASLNP